MARWITLIFIGKTQKKNLSFKTWAISVSGKKVSVRFGRAGKTQRQKTKTFRNTKDAAEAATKLMKSKLAKGYTYFK